jgi:GNAT superfamily N-acetyltransferase
VTENDGLAPARPSLVVRAATPADVADLAELAGELGYPCEPADMARRLASIAPGDEIRVAELDGRVAGWAHLTVHRSLAWEPFAEVLGLVVRDGMRGRGVGRALMNAAESWAIERGLASVRVRSAVHRDAAHAFYRALGYSESKRQAVFVKRIRG